MTITADNQTKVYGAQLPTLTASYSGFVNGDTPANLDVQPTLSTTATAASNAGAYAITASGAADPDYTISYVSGTLTVTPASLTITAVNQTKVYGAALPTLTAGYSGFVNGDTSASLTTQPTLLTTATASSHVSGNPYTITASGAVDPNYSIIYAAGILTVTPAPLTITADNQTKTYGAALPTLTATYTGLVNGDTAASLTTPPTLTTTATASSHVGNLPHHRRRCGRFRLLDQLCRRHTDRRQYRARPSPPTTRPRSTAPLLPALTVSYSGFVNGDTPASLTTHPPHHHRHSQQPRFGQPIYDHRHRSSRSRLLDRLCRR